MKNLKMASFALLTSLFFLIAFSSNAHPRHHRNNGRAQQECRKSCNSSVRSHRIHRRNNAFNNSCRPHARQRAIAHRRHAHRHGGR
ncbi:MAG TPA: hypothetical protein PLU17_02135 [Chitinophagaceae bacterium]|nr:hypothetical protein [Chitinophagaceae bacterium]